MERMVPTDQTGCLGGADLPIVRVGSSVPTRLSVCGACIVRQRGWLSFGVSISYTRIALLNYRWFPKVIADC